MSYSFGENTQTRVELFIMAQTGTYQEQTIRPFKTNYTDRVVNMLSEATRHGERLGVAAVNAIAADVIQPSANIEGFVGIPEGWASRRFRFLMRVVEQHPFTPNEKTIRIFFGYSNHSDVSHGGLLDPETRIYFNSETTIRDKITPGVNGMVRQANVTAANQIITPMRIMNAGRTGGIDSTHMIRPEDVFNLRETSIISDMAAQNIAGGIDLTYDTRALSGVGSFQLSRRRDTSPTRYVADTLGSLQHAVKENNMLQQGYAGNNTMGPNVFSEASACAANNSIGSDLFLAKLRDHCAYMERGYVTLRDLIGLFPEVGNFDQVTKYALDDGRGVRQVSFAEQSNHWQGADKTSIAASLIAQVVPAIMMDNFIRNIAIAVTNSMIPGQYAMTINEKLTRSIVDEVNMTPYIQEFERRFCVDALNSITFGGNIPFHITVMGDLAGDTIIDISLDGEQSVRFIAPTFTDSLFSPMVSTQLAAASKVSNDMIAIASDVLDLGQSGVNFNVAAPMPVTMDPSYSGASGYAENFGLL
ncbi:hypothetical protein D3C71_310560 [compost metagenome]